jgi:hypothetical protein
MDESSEDGLGNESQDVGKVMGLKLWGRQHNNKKFQ